MREGKKSEGWAFMCFLNKIIILKNHHFIHILKVEWVMSSGGAPYLLVCALCRKLVEIVFFVLTMVRYWTQKSLFTYSLRGEMDLFAPYMCNNINLHL